MSQTNKRTATSALLTVEHWRERLAQIRPEKITLRVLAERLSAHDDYFEGIVGYDRLKNIVNNRAGLEPTARTVRLMKKLKLVRQLFTSELPSA